MMRAEILFKNGSVKIGFIFMGTILGAGFASGQEIMRFFCDYGFLGFLGLFITCLLLFLSGLGILKIMAEQSISSSRQFLCLLFGENLGIAFNTLSSLFLFFMLSAMLAGGGEAIHSCFSINERTGAVIMAFLVFVAFLGGENYIGKINMVVCPILILVVLILSFFVIGDKIDSAVFFPKIQKKGALFYAFNYASYNIITALTVLCGLKEGIKNKKSCFWGILLGSAGLLMMALLLYFCLNLNYTRVYAEPLPLLKVAKGEGCFFYWLYFLLFFSAVFTTAIGNGFGLLKWLEDFGINSFFSAIGIIIVSLYITRLGFTKLVSGVYPLFGIMGGFEVILIIKKAFFEKRRFN